MLKLKLVTILSLFTLSFVLMACADCDLDPYDNCLTGIDSVSVVNSSPSIQMYFYIKKYADEFDIPEAYAFSLAYQETRYQGPLDMNYRHKQVSCVGAVGPMQIMPSTAKFIYGHWVPTNQLKSDIQMNVMISMKLLRYLYDIYGDWGLVFGAYNTGHPCINQYAKNILNKQYSWLSYND
jgi:soluble lytic murein transglycosylase-like protein